MVRRPPQPSWASENGPGRSVAPDIQAQAAKRLKVSQPRISDLIRGKISRFSLDSLVNMLTDAGLEVNFRIKPQSRQVA